MITIGDILEIEARRQHGELVDVLSCPHAKQRTLADLFAVELERQGELTAYLCCAACRAKCHELMAARKDLS